MADERHLVLAGGGHAHVEVLRGLARDPLPGWHVTLLTREAVSPYSGMLPGVAAGLYRAEQALIPIAPLAARAGAALVLDSVTGLDPAARLIQRAGGASIVYDLLSLDTGATPDLSVPGAAEHAIPLKPIDALLPRLDALVERARPGQTIAVVGAGAAGTEMALAMAVRLGPAGVQVVLVGGKSGLLPGLPASFRRHAAAALERHGVTLRASEDVAAVTADGIASETAPPLRTDAVIWATSAAPAAWMAHSGLARDPRGFLHVETTLQAVGHPAIFAAGDAAAFTPPLAKAGVFAVRQAPVLADNLRAAALGKPLRSYVPQRDWLVLLSTGDGRAIGTRNGISFEGRWVWWWKDRIDRRFVQRYQGA